MLGLLQPSAHNHLLLLTALWFAFSLPARVWVRVAEETRNGVRQTRSPCRTRLRRRASAGAADGRRGRRALGELATERVTPPNRRGILAGSRRSRGKDRRRRWRSTHPPR